MLEADFHSLCISPDQCLPIRWGLLPILLRVLLTVLTGIIPVEVVGKMQKQNLHENTAGRKFPS